ncbi:MAG: hypothetical protein WC528_01045 [Patescibacteria group bacterium]
MSLWKKILLMAGFVAVAVGFGYFIFRVFFGPANGNINGNINGNVNGALPNANLVNRPPTNENVNGVLPNINVGGNVNAGIVPVSPVAAGGATVVKEITDNQTQDAVMDSNSRDFVYYDRASGEFRKVSADGSQKSLLTSDTFPAADQVYWSPSRDKAVVAFPDDSKIVYDFNQKKQYSLPEETTEFSFSQDGRQMVYKYEGYNAEERWLAVSNPDGSGSKIVESIGDKSDFVSVDWAPNNQIVATYARSMGLDRQEIVFLGQNNENFPSVEVNGRNFQSAWSPAGDRIIYSVSSNETDYNPTLWVMNGAIENLGQYPQELGVATWPDKCAFGLKNIIYCAVPKYLPSGSDIYPELAGNISDDFYRIDLTTGAKTLLATPVNSSGYGSYTAEKVFLSANEEFLSFTDKSTGRLYQIRLK